MSTATSVTMSDREDQEFIAKARRQPFHPLQIIPFFRRFECSPLRDVVYTLIWNCMLGLIFSALAVMFTGRVSVRLITVNLFMANLIGYTIHALFLLGSFFIEDWVLRRGQVVITLYYTITSSLGVMIGFTIAAFVYNWNLPKILGEPSWYIGITVNSLIISIIIGVIYFWRERSQLAEMRLERERTRVAEIERNATMANLRLLQAQIEPHFLFNTLANVVGLIHPAPDTAKRMLEEFIAYLRATLAATREQQTTLGKEFELMSHFLAILQIRMGERLKVEVELPAELAGLALPSMLLQPLVENAIKHGLEPKIDGGTITLRAVREGDMLKLSVIDSGIGFTGATSGGIGLKNVRERIEKLFDGKGSMVIEENQPTGTKVQLTIPAMLSSSTGAASGALLPEEAHQC